MPASLKDVEEALEARGLISLGAFHPQPDDGVPALADGRPAATVVLAGNAGPAMWAAFRHEAPAGDHPLDAWARRVLGEIAGAVNATAFFPDAGPPYLPFQRWALRAGPVHVSPLGILIHAEYGLWHGYRGALAFPGAMDLPAPAGDPSPCESCADKPCLSACPVGAFTRDGYDVEACVGHVSTDRGRTCLTEGCLARRACPVGQTYAYGSDQAEFHMAAFLRANRRRGRR